MKTLICSCGSLIYLEDEDFINISARRWGCYGTRRVYSTATVGGVREKVTLSSFLLSCPSKTVDHKDRNFHNFLRSNLRFANATQQAQNRNVRIDSISGIKGVVKVKRKWRAYIVVNGVKRHLGYFDSAIEAAAAYDKAAKENFGDFACLNLEFDSKEYATT